jgi:hypothetical protein
MSGTEEECAAKKLFARQTIGVKYKVDVAFDAQPTNRVCDRRVGRCNACGVQQGVGGRTGTRAAARAGDGDGRRKERWGRHGVVVGAIKHARMAERGMLHTEDSTTTLKVREISEALHVSKPYAALVRAGRRRPHPKHWKILAELVNIPA